VLVTGVPPLGFTAGALGPGAPYPAVTDDQGNFTIEGIEPGTYVLGLSGRADAERTARRESTGALSIRMGHSFWTTFLPEHTSCTRLKAT
jgi:hypothetical protein